MWYIYHMSKITLSSKSDENLLLARNCFKSNQFLNASLSSIYYATYQKIKNKLYYWWINDPKITLHDKGAENKFFDHSALKARIKDYAVAKGIKAYTSVMETRVNDNLYVLRRKRNEVDYDVVTDSLDKKKYRFLLAKAKLIIKLIDTFF
jgi:hypothetical protein